MENRSVLKQKNKVCKRATVGGVVVFILIALGLTHDIILTNILAYRICKANPNKKTFIIETVEYPESVYWEDNIYPGFDEKDRLLMIRNYLDGVHLKTMALNAPDGTIYIFTATIDDWQRTNKIKIDEDPKTYFSVLEEEAKVIANRAKKATPEQMPDVNFSVIFNPLPLTSFQQRYLYSDEVIILNNQSGEIIASNRRLMRFYYWLEPKPVGGCISMTNLFHKAISGEPSLYNLDDKTILKYQIPNNILNNFKCKRSFKIKR